MFQTIIIASLALSAVAFRPAPMARVSLNKISMNAEGLNGISGPLGYFDPLGKRHQFESTTFECSDSQ